MNAISDSRLVSGLIDIYKTALAELNSTTPFDGVQKLLHIKMETERIDGFNSKKLLRYANQSLAEYYEAQGNQEFAMGYYFSALTAAEQCSYLGKMELSYTLSAKQTAQTIQFHLLVRLLMLCEKRDFIDHSVFLLKKALKIAPSIWEPHLLKRLKDTAIKTQNQALLSAVNHYEGSHTVIVEPIRKQPKRHVETEPPILTIDCIQLSSGQSVLRVLQTVEFLLRLALADFDFAAVKDNKAELQTLKVEFSCTSTRIAFVKEPKTTQITKYLPKDSLKKPEKGATGHPISSLDVLPQSVHSETGNQGETVNGNAGAEKSSRPKRQNNPPIDKDQFRLSIVENILQQLKDPLATFLLPGNINVDNQSQGTFVNTSKGILLGSKRQLITSSLSLQEFLAVSCNYELQSFPNIFQLAFSLVEYFKLTSGLNDSKSSHPMTLGSFEETVFEDIVLLLCMHTSNLFEYSSDHPHSIPLLKILLRLYRRLKRKKGGSSKELFELGRIIQEQFSWEEGIEKGKLANRTGEWALLMSEFFILQQDGMQTEISADIPQQAKQTAQTQIIRKQSSKTAQIYLSIYSQCIPQPQDQQSRVRLMTLLDYKKIEQYILRSNIAAEDRSKHSIDISLEPSPTITIRIYGAAFLQTVQQGKSILDSANLLGKFCELLNSSKDANQIEKSHNIPKNLHQNCSLLISVFSAALVAIEEAEESPSDYIVQITNCIFDLIRQISQISHPKNKYIVKSGLFLAFQTELQKKGAQSKALTKELLLSFIFKEELYFCLEAAQKKVIEPISKAISDQLNKHFESYLKKISQQNESQSKQRGSESDLSKQIYLSGEVSLAYILVNPEKPKNQRKKLLLAERIIFQSLHELFNFCETFKKAAKEFDQMLNRAFDDPSSQQMGILSGARPLCSCCRLNQKSKALKCCGNLLQSHPSDNGVNDSSTRYLSYYNIYLLLDMSLKTSWDTLIQAQFRLAVEDLQTNPPQNSTYIKTKKLINLALKRINDEAQRQTYSIMKGYLNALKLKSCEIASFFNKDLLVKYYRGLDQFTVPISIDQIKQCPALSGLNLSGFTMKRPVQQIQIEDFRLIYIQSKSLISQLELKQEYFLLFKLELFAFVKKWIVQILGRLSLKKQDPEIYFSCLITICQMFLDDYSDDRFEQSIKILQEKQRMKALGQEQPEDENEKDRVMEEQECPPPLAEEIGLGKPELQPQRHNIPRQDQQEKQPPENNCNNWLLSDQGHNLKEMQEEGRKIEIYPQNSLAQMGLEVDTLRPCEQIILAEPTINLQIIRAMQSEDESSSRAPNDRMEEEQQNQQGPTLIDNDSQASVNFQQAIQETLEREAVQSKRSSSVSKEEKGANDQRLLQANTNKEKNWTRLSPLIEIVSLGQLIKKLQPNVQKYFESPEKRVLVEKTLSLILDFFKSFSAKKKARDKNGHSKFPDLTLLAVCHITDIYERVELDPKKTARHCQLYVKLPVEGKLKPPKNIDWLNLYSCKLFRQASHVQLVTRLINIYRSEAKRDSLLKLTLDLHSQDGALFKQSALACMEILKQNRKGSKVFEKLIFDALENDNLLKSKDSTSTSLVETLLKQKQFILQRTSASMKNKLHQTEKPIINNSADEHEGNENQAQESVPLKPPMLE